MIVDDVDVEIQKFKMFAEKADSEAKVIELCKKYLKHKGIDVDHAAAARDYLASQIVPPTIEKQYVGLRDLNKLEATVSIDWDRLEDGGPEIRIQYQKRLIDQLVHELVKADAIKFHEYKNFSSYQQVMMAQLFVYRDKTR